MRELMITRIRELRDCGSATHVIFIKPSLTKKKKTVIPEGCYPWDYDFSGLDDVQLLAAFEKVCRWAYKPWA